MAPCKGCIQQFYQFAAGIYMLFVFCMWVLYIQVIIALLYFFGAYLPCIFILSSVVPPVLFKIKLFYIDGLCFVVAFTPGG